MVWGGGGKEGWWYGEGVVKRGGGMGRGGKEGWWYGGSYLLEVFKRETVL